MRRHCVANRLFLQAEAAFNVWLSAYSGIFRNKLVQNKLIERKTSMQQKYIKNTAILFVSMAITKIVGALFKIPLANLLGGTGMGYFSTAYGLYSPIFAVTAAGVPTVIMRITAQSVASERHGYASAVKNTAMMFFAAVGLVGTLATAFFAKPFAEHIACSPQSTPAIICIAPAVMLCCIGAVLRGYYEGMANVVPSSAASVAEAVSRAVFGLLLSYAVIFYAKQRFESGLTVFGTDPASAEQAYRAALPYAAAGAVLAVSISELCGLITLIIADKKRKRTDALPKFEGGRRCICFRLIRETAPIAASALVMNCVSFVDLLTVTRSISGAIASEPEYFNRAFSGILVSCDGLAGLPNFMYGSYTGIATSLFMLIPSFAGMTEKTFAPEIAAAWERHDLDTLSGRIFMQFRSAAVIGCPACFGAAALAGPILTMLYKSRAAEVSVCLDSFVILCMGGLFMVTASAMFGIFQAICKAHIPLILMICSVCAKLILNPILISIPAVNISGAALSSAAGYILMTVMGAAAMKKYIPVKINLARAVIPPAICGIVCGAGAYITHLVLKNQLNNIASVLISVGAGAILYVLLLIISGVFRTSGIIRQKNAKKFQKPLAKSSKIG